MKVWMLPLTVTLFACTGATGGSDSNQEEERSNTATDTGPTDPSRGLLFTGPRPHNLLIVSFDTLRHDKIGAYSDSGVTPFLDSLLDESVVHTDLRGCSNWTYSSVLCLMTGQSTVDLGYEPATGDDKAPAPPDQIDMLPLWLGNHGFESTVVTGSPWLTTEKGVLTGEGYDTIVYDDWGDPYSFPGADWTTTHALTEAERLLNTDRDHWFLHVHYMDPHTPYDAPEEYRSELETLEPIPWDLTTGEGMQEAKQAYNSLSTKEQELLLEHFAIHYEADIRFMDDQLQLLWVGLAEMGALQDTLVLFWSDHGEQFYDHQKWGHSQGLNQEENRALGAWWSKNLTPKLWEVPVQHQDLIHLMYRALRLTPEPSWTSQDPDQISSDRFRTAFRYTLDTDGRWMATRGHELLTYRCNGSKSFYNTEHDPQEKLNNYDAQNPSVIALWEDLQAELDRTLEYLPQLDCKDLGP